MLKHILVKNRSVFLYGKSARRVPRKYIIANPQFQISIFFFPITKNRRPFTLSSLHKIKKQHFSIKSHTQWRIMAKVFKGANVFMSRNLVPPELFDALHDALKLNGAQVFLCCDPSRNGPNDYHVIASGDHVKCLLIYSI